MTRPSALPTVCRIHNFRITSEWEQAKESNPPRQKKRAIKPDFRILQDIALETEMGVVLDLVPVLLYKVLCIK
jgi:hypothetical protein